MEQEQKNLQKAISQDQNSNIFVSPRNNIDLNARLNQGYNPSTEFGDRGKLLSSVALWTLPADYLVETLQPDLARFKETNSNLDPSILVEDTSPLFIVQSEGFRSISAQASGVTLLNNSSVLGLPSETGSSILSGLGSQDGTSITLTDSPLPQADQKNVAAKTTTAFAQSPQAMEMSSPSMMGKDSMVASTDTSIDNGNNGGNVNTGNNTSNNTAPIITMAAVMGREDQTSALNIQVTPGNGENVADINVVITGLPTGTILSAGTHNPDNSWTLTIAELTNLTITPPANYSGVINIQAVAISSTDGLSSNANSSITIDSVADAPNLSVTAVTGNEDSAIALLINTSLVDTDGSENLSITIGNVPNGATLSAGINNGNGTWTHSCTT